MILSLSLLRRATLRSACIAGLAAAASLAAYSAVPTDIVPVNSGAYDALALLAKDRLLPDGMGVETFLGDTARLRTRAEMLSLVDGARASVQDAELTPRDLAAFHFLEAYLADPGVEEHTPHWATSSTATASVMGEAGAQKVNGKSNQAFGDIFGTARVFGTVGGNAYYTAGVTNRFQQRDEYLSFNTRYGGRTPDDIVIERNGLQEAYLALAGKHGLRFDIGERARNWGPGYTGSMLLSGNAPARPGIELEAPVWLGHELRLFRFTQVQEEYNHLGKQIYTGFRRLDHPLGHGWDIDAQESYAATKLRSPAILVLPYYLYQKLYIKDNNTEPNEFNYNAQGGLTVKTDATGDGTAYLQFFVDDIQSPKGIGLGNTVPRKIGYLVGANQPVSTSTHVVVEYVHTDPQTYTKTTFSREPLGWFIDDLPIGSLAGPNAQAVYGRIDQKLGNRVDLAVSGMVRHRFSSSFPAPNDGILNASLAYQVNLSQSVAIRYADFREDPYTGSTVVNPSGGADYGVSERQKLVGIDYLVGF